MTKEQERMKQELEQMTKVFKKELKVKALKRKVVK